MFCPQCRAEYHGQTECPECHVPLDRLAGPGTPPDSSVEFDELGDVDLDVLIRTGFRDPIAIGLAKSL
jgi:hypothetical protein